MVAVGRRVADGGGLEDGVAGGVGPDPDEEDDPPPPHPARPTRTARTASRPEQTKVAEPGISSACLMYQS
jgi:hypothetical protein